MKRKGLDGIISLIVAIIVLVSVALVLSFILTSRTEVLSSFGIQNTGANFTSFIGG